MSVEDLYIDFRSLYGAITSATDIKHEKMWDSTEHEVKAVWFDSLANVINDRMGKTEHEEEISEIFNYLEMKYRTGSDEVKSCIDVCFVENLFWEVPRKRAGLAWANLPMNLKDLYLDFHSRKPV